MKSNGITFISHTNGIQLPGNLTVPEGARGAVIFSHGSGSSRFSRLLKTDLRSISCSCKTIQTAQP